MLERFVKAKDKTYAGALAELREGKKRAPTIVGPAANCERTGAGGLNLGCYLYYFDIKDGIVFLCALSLVL
jgi:hypothetical protein